MPAGRVPLRGVFRRGDGTLHLRLDASRSVPVKLDRASGIWIPRGVARPLDPHETVRLIEE
jgi:hypothetical protein